MADKPEPLEHVVFRIIREQLREGYLDRLIQVLSAVQAALGSGEPIHVNANLQGGGQVAGAVTVSPTPALIFVTPGTPEVSVSEAVSAIQSASPGLTNEIQNRPQDVGKIIDLFVAFLTALMTLMTAYQIVHGQPVPQPQIVEFFNQTYNVVINAPHG